MDVAPEDLHARAAQGALDVVDADGEGALAAQDVPAARRARQVIVALMKNRGERSATQSADLVSQT